MHADKKVLINDCIFSARLFDLDEVYPMRFALVRILDWNVRGVNASSPRRQSSVSNAERAAVGVNMTPFSDG